MPDIIHIKQNVERKMELAQDPPYITRECRQEEERIEATCVRIKTVAFFTIAICTIMGCAFGIQYGWHKPPIGELLTVNVAMAFGAFGTGMGGGTLITRVYKKNAVQHFQKNFPDERHSSHIEMTLLHR